MKTVGIVTRPNFSAGEEEAGRLLKFLEAKGLSVMMPPYLAENLERPELGCDLSALKADFVITLGGDGTILHAARTLPSDVPLVPVNVQSFGFLSECEIEDAQTLLNQILAGNFEVQELFRLASWLEQERLVDATNEVSLFPERSGRPSLFQIKITEGCQLKFRGDGLIVSTPSGSTGHALSLGGPVLHPLVEAILVLPVAPLRRSMLPLVVHKSTTLQVRVGKIANLVIDGVLTYQVPEDVPLTIKHSDSPLRLLRRDNSFYRRLRTKLLR